MKKRVFCLMVLVFMLCLQVTPISAAETGYLAPLYNEDQIGTDPVLAKQNKVRVILKANTELDGATEQVESAIKEAGGEYMYVFQSKGMENWREATIPVSTLDSLRAKRNIKSISAVVQCKPTTQTIPDSIDKAYGLSYNKANYCSGYTGTGVKVGIIDSGIDTDHSDLQNLVAGGKNMYTMGTTPSDYDDSGGTGYGHGTHTSGTIAAQDNTEGVVGVAPNVDLYVCKIWSTGGTASLESCIDWCVTQDVDIISMSLLYGTTEMSTIATAQAIAHNAGITMVACSGNDNGTVNYPAANQYTIAVGAVDSSNVRAAFSDYGSALDVMAQGVSVTSTTVGGGTGLMTGTSMACPNVAGIMALLKQEFPSKPPDQLEAILKVNALDLGTTGFDNYYGFGLARVSVTKDSFEAMNAGTMPYGWTNENRYGVGTSTTSSGWSTDGSKSIYLYDNQIYFSEYYESMASKTFDITGISSISFDYNVYRLNNGGTLVLWLKITSPDGNTSYAYEKVDQDVNATWKSGSVSQTLPTGLSGNWKVSLLLCSNDAISGGNIQGYVDNLKLIQ